jgi:hypothetical protein
MMKKILQLHPKLQAAVKRNSNYYLIQKMMGFQNTERLFAKVYGRRTANIR